LQLRVWELDHDMSSANDSIISVGSKLEGYITELSPGKAFNLRVLAYSNGGDGRMSSPTLTFQMGQYIFLKISATKIKNVIVCNCIHWSVCRWQGVVAQWIDCHYCSYFNSTTSRSRFSSTKDAIAPVTFRSHVIIPFFTILTRYQFQLISAAIFPLNLLLRSGCWIWIQIIKMI